MAAEAAALPNDLAGKVASELVCSPVVFLIALDYAGIAETVQIRCKIEVEGIEEAACEERLEAAEEPVL